MRPSIKLPRRATRRPFLIGSTAFSFHGVSDQVARGYMEKHGTASWSKMEATVRNSPSCPKLQTFWDYVGCGYE